MLFRSREAAKGKGKRKEKSVSSHSSAIDPAFTDELRQMRITREKELESMNQMGSSKLEVEKMKINQNLLSSLLSKPILSPEEEVLKNRLMQKFM